MAVPIFPTPPDPPQRGVDPQPVFSPKADVFTAWMGWQLKPDLEQFGIDLIAAAAGAGYSSVSTSSITIGNGSKNLTVESGKMFVPGEWIVISDVAAPTTNWMLARISTYNRTTGAMTVDAVRFGGSGTKFQWFIGLSGPPGALVDGVYGDVTISGNGTVITFNNDTVTNAKLANMPTARIKGRTSSGTGDPEDLTPAQVTAMLDIFTASLKGLVPSSGGGTSTYLRADGVWGSPSAAASAWTQIGAEIVATGAGPWAFTSIPDIYSDLLLVYVVRANTSGGQLNVSLGTGGSYGAATMVFSGNFAGSGAERHGSLYVPAYNYDRGTWLFGGNLATSPSQSGGMMTGSNSAMAGGGWTVSGGVDSIRVSVSAVTLIAPSSFKLFGR